MFIGEYLHTLDSKGRLSVPKKFRADLKDGAVITRGLDGCLFLHPKKKWQEFEEQLIELPITKADARVFSRHMFASAMEVEIDRVGRILIPQYLRDYAVLKNEVMVIGVGKRIEIWDKACWERYRARLEPEKVAERLSELGI